MSDKRRKLEEILKLLGMSNSDIRFLDGYEGSDLASAKMWIERRKANKDFSRSLNKGFRGLLKKANPDDIRRAKKWIENRNKGNGKDSK